MAVGTLTGQTLASTYKRLLKLKGSTTMDTIELLTNAIQLEDGDGVDLPIYLSTDKIGIGTSTPSAQLELSADFKVGTTSTFVGDVTTNANLNIGGNLVVTGTSTFNGGTINLGDGTGDTINLGSDSDDNVVFGGVINSHIIPESGDETIGDSGNRWANVYSTLLNVSGVATLPNVDINGGDISGVTISGGTVSGGLTWSSPQDLNNQALTNVNIDSGIIKGATIDICSWGGAQDISGHPFTNVNIDSGDIAGGVNISGGLNWTVAQKFLTDTYVGGVAGDQEFKVESTDAAATITLDTGSTSQVGQLNFDLDGTVKGAIIYDHDDAAASQVMKFNTGNSDYLYLKNNKVGIQMNDPQAHLHIAGTNPEILLTDNSGGTGPSDGFSIVQTSSNTTLSNQENGDISFKTGSDTFAMIIDESQDVGIGIEDPYNAKLHLNSAGHTYLRLDTTHGSHETGIIFDNSADNDMTWFIGRTSAGDLTFTQANEDGADEVYPFGDIHQRMVIQSSGEVGIGIGDPKSLLHINGTNPRILLTDSGAGSTLTDGFSIYQEGANTMLRNQEDGYILMGADEADQIYFASGNPRIGIAGAPTSTLHIYHPDTSGPNDSTLANLGMGGITIENNQASAGDLGSVLTFRRTGGQTGDAFIIGQSVSDTNGELQFWTENSGTNDKSMTIKSNNDVIMESGVQIGAWQSSAVAGAIKWNGSNFQGYDGSSWLNLDNDVTVNSAGGWTDGTGKVYPTGTSDNVAIGHDSPDANTMLHVKADQPGDALVKFDNIDTSTGDGLFIKTKSPNAYKALRIQTDVADDDSYIEKFALYNSGRIISSVVAHSSYPSWDLQNVDNTTANALGMYIKAGADSTDTGYILSTYTMSNNPALFIRGDGNVGIGCTGTSISSKLHITDSNDGAPIVLLENTHDNGNAAKLKFLKNGTSPAASDNCGFIQFAAENADQTQFNFATINGSSQSVVVGDECGAMHFELLHDGAMKNVFEINANGQGTPGAGLIVFNEQAQDYDFRVESSTRPFAFFMQGSSGNIGIGESQPDHELHVQGSNTTTGSLWDAVGPGNIPGMIIQNAATDDNNYAGYFFKNDANNVGGIVMQMVTHSSDASTIHIANSTSGTVSTKMLIDYNGQVGIGTLSPDALLHVSGDMIVGREGAGAGSGTASYFAMQRNDAIVGGLSTTGGIFSLFSGTDATTKHVVLRNGRLGIGFDDPQSPLHIKSATADILRLESTDATNEPYIAFHDDVGRKGVIGYGGYGNEDSISIHNEENSDIRFGTNDTFAMIIDESQKVGIGVDTSLGYLFNVLGQSQFYYATDEDVIFTKRSADSTHRFAISTEGKLSFGPGSSTARDVHISRSNTETLKIDGSNRGELEVTGKIMNQGLRDQAVNSMSAPYFHLDGGNSSYITTGINPGGIINSSPAYSYSFWARSTHNAKQTIFGHGGSKIGVFSLWHEDGKPLIYLHDNYYTYFEAQTKTYDGEWHHYVVVINATDIANSKFYVDGESQSTSSPTAVSAATAYTQTLTIGAYQNTGSDEFRGDITDFKVFNHELTQKEVNSYAAGGTIPFEHSGANENNLVHNGDFEQDTADPPENFTDTGNQNGSAVAEGTAPSGSNVYMVTSTGTGGGYSTNYWRYYGDSADKFQRLELGKRYKFSMVARQNSGDDKLNIWVQKGASEGADLTTEFTIDATFTRYSFEFTAYQEQLDIRGWIEDSGVYWIDQMEVKRIGCVADLDKSTIGNGEWKDKSGNGYHGTSASGATAQNQKGLITVGDNMLTNSGFGVWSGSSGPAVYGSQLLTDNGFDDDSAWTITQGTSGTVSVNTVVPSVLKFVNVQDGHVKQTGKTTPGRLYKFEITLNAYTDGKIRLFSGGTHGTEEYKYASITPTGTGAITRYFEAIGEDFTILVDNNGDMEASGCKLEEVTPSCTGSDLVAPDGWVKESNGDIDLYREPQIVKPGAQYALKAINTAASYIHYPHDNIASHDGWISQFAGKPVVFGCWMRANIRGYHQVVIDWKEGGGVKERASRKLELEDTWQWVEISQDLPDNLTFLQFELHCGAISTAYFCQPMVAIGNYIGEGNYSRPTNEVIYTEKEIIFDQPQKDGTYTSGTVDGGRGIGLNLAVESHGRIPHGAKAVGLNVKGSAGWGSTDVGELIFKSAQSGATGFVMSLGPTRDGAGETLASATNINGEVKTGIMAYHDCDYDENIYVDVNVAQPFNNVVIKANKIII